MMNTETKISEMGSIATTQGVAFRVWAPHAQQVAVIESFNELVINELQIGNFNDAASTYHAGMFASISARLGYLKMLGVSAIEIMPINEFVGDRSWGLQPCPNFLGGNGRWRPVGVQAMFDGWSENNRGGIYFYNDDRASTPWGETRPDYGRGEVRSYLRDSALIFSQ